MLVAGGAALNLEDRQGHTPRQLALESNDLELAGYLESELTMKLNQALLIYVK